MKPTDTPDQFEYCFSSDYWQVQAEFAFIVDFGDSAGLFEMFLERCGSQETLLLSRRVLSWIYLSNVIFHE